MPDKDAVPLSHQAALAGHIHLLKDAIESILHTHVDGLSELELIHALQAEPWQLVGPVDFYLPAALYPVHFLVFHCLYQLRDEFTLTGRVQLFISPLSIQLQPVPLKPIPLKPQAGPVDQPDQLRRFYLDLDNYQMSTEALDALLEDFWRGVQRPPHEAVKTALDELEFSALPDDYTEVKARFRQLAMQHHPDRGGSNSKLQALNRAISTLKKHFHD